MAMEMNGNFLDCSIGRQNYSSYMAQNETESQAADAAKKTAAEQIEKKTGRRKTESLTDYVNRLAKLAPSVDVRAGYSFSSARSGKTLTINPGLLKRMQHDPEQEKETKELIKGVEFITKFMDGIYKASGQTVVFRHGYIDENGKYRSFSYIKKVDKLSPKLRAQRQKISDKLILKSKEKAAKNKKELQKALEEKRTRKNNKKTGRAQEMIHQKIAASKDGKIYLYDTDFKTILEAAREDRADKAAAKKQTEAGANLDLQV